MKAMCMTVSHIGLQWTARMVWLPDG